jgi:hypothetical protein
MVDQFRDTAYMCIGRAVFFGSLAIFCTMVGCAFNPVIAFRAGAFLTLFMSATLLFKSHHAAVQNPKSTEVWLYLDKSNRPVDPASMRVFASVMRTVYGQFSWYSFIAATGFFALSLGFQAMGFSATLHYQSS